jgi:hypothetical protein
LPQRAGTTSGQLPSEFDVGDDISRQLLGGCGMWLGLGQSCMELARGRLLLANLKGQPYIPNISSTRNCVLSPISHRGQASWLLLGMVYTIRVGDGYGSISIMKSLVWF